MVTIIVVSLLGGTSVTDVHFDKDQVTVKEAMAQSGMVISQDVLAVNMYQSSDHEYCSTVYDFDDPVGNGDIIYVVPHPQLMLSHAQAKQIPSA